MYSWTAIRVHYLTLINVAPSVILIHVALQYNIVCSLTENNRKGPKLLLGRV